VSSAVCGDSIRTFLCNTEMIIFSFLKALTSMAWRISLPWWVALVTWIALCFLYGVMKQLLVLVIKHIF
jgi:hypothetical protein